MVLHCDKVIDIYVYYLIKVQNLPVLCGFWTFLLSYDTNLILKPVICPLPPRAGLGTGGRICC